MPVKHVENSGVGDDASAHTFSDRNLDDLLTNGVNAPHHAARSTDNSTPLGGIHVKSVRTTDSDPHPPPF